MKTQEIIVSLYRAFERSDIDAALGLFAPNVQHRIYSASVGAPFVGEFHGIEAMAEHLKSIHADWQARAIDAREVVVDGTRAAVDVRFEGQRRGENERISTHETHFFNLEEAGIVEFDVFFKAVRQWSGELPPLSRSEPRLVELHED